MGVLSKNPTPSLFMVSDPSAVEMSGNVRKCPEMSGEIKNRRTSIPECLPTTTVDLYKHSEWTKGVSDAVAFPG